MRLDLHRGDVVAVRLDPTEGSEIRKTRPAVVVSNDAACRADAVVQIVPLTGVTQRPLRPFEALIRPDSSGLARPSRAVANQIRTVARERIVDRLGTLSGQELARLGRAVSIQLDLRRVP